jgi:hypothetical protein
MADRKALAALIDTYFAAVTSRNASGLPLAKNVRYTENGQDVPLKWGLWATAAKRIYPPHLDLIDEERGQAATFAVVEEHLGRKAVLSTRLKLVGNELTEIETLICRGHEILFKPDGMAAPSTYFKSAIQPARRATREQAVRIADLYFDGIEQGNGKMIPIVDEALRFENGVQTVRASSGDLSAERQTSSFGSLSAAGQIDTGFFAYIPVVSGRRYPVFDKEKSTIYSLLFMEHPGHLTEVEARGFGKMKLAEFATKPCNVMIAEAFQIADGKIQTICAVLDFLPYKMKSGWEGRE